MGAIFGILGKYCKNDIDAMHRALKHRGGKCSICEFDTGFIASIAQSDQLPASSVSSETRAAVVDGYLSSDVSIKSLLDDSPDKVMENAAGLYSTAVFDNSTHELKLYRDPSGARPLYTTQTKSRFVFASTPDALFTLNDVNRSLSPQGVLLYLTMICPPDPVTIFDKINMIQPGFCCTISSSGLKTKPFWCAPWTPETECLNPDLAASKLRQVMEMAVLDAVPENNINTGFFLSGGTDTGAVVALAAINSKTPLNTFTIGYEGEGKGYEDYNEFYYAKLIADKFGTKHHEFYISPESVKKSLPGIIANLHQPSGDAINTYLVAGTLPPEIQTVLTGTGGDEVFIGSHWFRQQDRLIQSHAKWQSLPGFLRQMALSLSGIAGSRLKHRIDRLDALKGGVPAQYMHFKTMFSDYHTLFTPDYLSQLSDSLQAADIIDMYDVSVDGIDPINRMENLFFKHEVSNLQLRDVDSMSHAHGFEARSPLTDRRILDILCRVSGYAKAPQGQLRHLMFQALGDLLLTETKTRRKMSFIVPMDLWARRDLKPMIKLLLNRESIEKRGIFKADSITREWNAFYHSGTERHPFKIWNLALFELWCRYHIDLPVGSPIPETIEDLL